MRISVGVGPFRFYSNGRPRKPAPPIESMSRTGMIVITVIAEALAVLLAVTLFIMPASGSVATGITILVVWNLVLAWKWLMWWAGNHNPVARTQQIGSNEPINQASVSNRH
jgi:hypothetical protein